MTCDQLDHELATLHAIWPHLDTDDHARRAADHRLHCQCDDTPPPTKHLARDPRDDPKEETR